MLEANGGPAVLNNNWGLLAHWHAAFYGKGGFLKWLTVPSFSKGENEKAKLQTEQKVRKKIARKPRKQAENAKLRTLWRED